MRDLNYIVIRLEGPKKLIIPLQGNPKKSSGTLLLGFYGGQGGWKKFGFLLPLEFCFAAPL